MESARRRPKKNLLPEGRREGRSDLNFRFLGGVLIFHSWEGAIIIQVIRTEAYNYLIYSAFGDALLKPGKTGLLGVEGTYLYFDFLGGISNYCGFDCQNLLGFD